MGVGRKAGGIGIGTIVMALVAMYFGVDPSVVLRMAGGLSAPSGQQQQQPRSQAENQLADMTTVVLADTEDTWGAIFKAAGKRYKEPKLVMFTGTVKSGYGMAEAAMGPFYCPADQKVYIDLSFAGVWANNANRSRQILETGDVEEALTAASAIGDDRLQKQARGYVTPDSFTHGTSEQRVRWFKRGLNSGNVADCNTFAGL